MNNIRKRKNNLGQTILELSILGSVLLLLFGMLIRYSTSVSEAQKIQLKAFRQALETSALATSSNAGKRSATILWIEDRETVEGGQKYGSSSRTPSIAMGSGNFSSLLNYSVEYGEWANLPTMDIVVNGKTLSLQTATFRCIGYNCADSPFEYLDLSSLEDPDKPRAEWNMNIRSQTECRYNPYAYMPVWTPAPGANWTIDNGAPTLIFWAKIPRTHKKFCIEGHENSSPPSQWDPIGHQCDIHPNEVNARFDLRRTGSWNAMPDINDRLNIQWQWYPVSATGAGINYYGDTADERWTMVDVDFDGKIEAIVAFQTVGKIAVESSPNTVYHDFTATYTSHDGDDPRTSPKIEGYLANFFISPILFQEMLNRARVRWVKVIDYDDGDIDGVYDIHDRLGTNILNAGDPIPPKPRPGFVDTDARIITITPDAFLEITQKPLGSSQETILKRTKDSYTIVERRFQMSNETGRFDPYNDLKFAHPDLVEVACWGSGCCGDPLDQSHPNVNKNKTCYDRTDKILFIRSRLADKSGYKAKTIEPIN